jgi:imidazolonepropionase-like amidohydrolase
MLLAVALALAAPKVVLPADGHYAIVKVTVVPVSGPNVPDSAVVVKDGKIVQVGGVIPDDLPKVDGAGGFLLPGLIDIHSHMGVYAWPGGSGNSDGNEAVEPFTPRVWSGDSFDPEDPAIARARAGGVTTIQVLPGSANLIGGQAAVLKLRAARTIDGMRFPEAPRSIKMACGENPKRVYGEEDEHDVRIQTRMGEIAALRAEFRKTVEYVADRKARKVPDDPDLDVLADVLAGKIRVNLHCYRSFDIAGWYRVADEYGFNITTIHHALETYKVRDLLAAHGTGIATWPDWWGFKLEAYDGIPWGPALVSSVGVPVATHSDSASHVQRLYLEAAKLVRWGMTEQDALESITLDPARLLGVDPWVGSIEPGKQADLALFDRNPLDGFTKVIATFIDGQLVYDRARDGGPSGRR